MSDLRDTAPLEWLVDEAEEALAFEGLLTLHELSWSLRGHDPSLSRVPVTTVESMAGESTQEHLVGLIRTMEALVAGEIPAAVFDDRYRAQFSELPLGLDESTFATLETLFFACEDYVADPALRDPGDLDDDALLGAARTALVALAGRT